MIFVHCHIYRCSPRLVGFAATKIVSGDTKALDLGGTWVSLIKTNVDLSLQKSMAMSMHISRGYPLTYPWIYPWVYQWTHPNGFEKIAHCLLKSDLLLHMAKVTCKWPALSAPARPAKPPRVFFLLFKKVTCNRTCVSAGHFFVQIPWAEWKTQPLDSKDINPPFKAK